MPVTSVVPISAANSRSRGEEIGALSGISRQNTNQCLKQLKKEEQRLDYGGLAIRSTACAVLASNQEPQDPTLSA
jgi:hypothetical protein